MAMTKKDFEKLATALAWARPPLNPERPQEFSREILKAQDEQWVKTVNAVCDALVEINPNFSYGKFIDWINELLGGNKIT